MRRSAISRFWRNVICGPDCWEWDGSRVEGYGAFGLNGKRVLAHRFIYEFTYGALPPGVVVMHSCDNPSCVRIDHLYMGTRKSNVMDAVHKGRHAHRLTEEQVRELRALRAEGVPTRELAAKYGVSEDTAYFAAVGRSWAHIPNPNSARSLNLQRTQGATA